MMLNITPKFEKVEILVKINNTELPSTININFDDCGLLITGDYIIVTIDKKDEIKNTLTTTSKVFALKDVAAYKTHSK